MDDIIEENMLIECPKCGSKEVALKGKITTLVYYPPIYNAKGQNMNPDMNTTKSDFECLSCGNVFNLKNNTDEE